MSPRTDGAFSHASILGEGFAEVWPYEMPLDNLPDPHIGTHTAWCPAATPLPVVDQVITAFSDIDDTMLVAGEHASRWLHGGARHGRGLTTWARVDRYGPALPFLAESVTPLRAYPRLVILPTPCTCTTSWRPARNRTRAVRRAAVAISRMAYDGHIVTATAAPLNPPSDRRARKRAAHGDDELTAVIRTITDHGYSAVRHIVATPIGARRNPTSTLPATHQRAEATTPSQPPPAQNTRASMLLVMVQLMVFAHRSTFTPVWTPPADLEPGPGYHRHKAPDSDDHRRRHLPWPTRNAGPEDNPTRW